MKERREIELSPLEVVTLSEMDPGQRCGFCGGALEAWEARRWSGDHRRCRVESLGLEDDARADGR